MYEMYDRAAGYPAWVLLAVLVLGLPMATWRPYWLGVVAVILLSTASVFRFTFTRLPGTGEFLNLWDACLLMAIVAIISTKMREGDNPIPGVVKGMLICFAVGTAMAMLFNGLGFEVGRARMRLTNPILMTLGACVCWDYMRLRKLLIVFLIVAIVQGIRQLAMFVGLMAVGGGWGTARGAELMAVGGLLFPASILLCGEKDKQIKILSLVALGFSLIALMLRQTRSEWIPTLFGMMVLLFISSRGNFVKIVQKTLIMIVSLVVLVALAEVLMPGRNSPLTVFTEGRAMAFIFDADDGLGEIDVGRSAAGIAELEAWSSGNMLVGEGFFYERAARHQELVSKYRHISWRHIGLVAILARMGLLGFFIFVIWLPVMVFRNSHAIRVHTPSVGAMAIGSFVAARMISALAESCITPGLMNNNMPVFALFIGIVWRWHYDLKQEKAFSELEAYMVTNANRLA